MKNVKCLSSSQAYILVKDQLAKAKAVVVQYQALFEKLQVEKDNLAWREKEFNLKSDVVDVFHHSVVVVDYRISELGKEMRKQITERHVIETKLEEASREPGRKEIIAEFKALVSSFPAEMGSMQSQISKYKEAASDVHSLRADVLSLSNVLDRKVRVNTRLLYQQTKFNLLCEESEGYAKLVLECFELQPDNVVFVDQIPIFPKSHASQILGFKFQYYQRLEVNSIVPFVLYQLTALLVKKTSVILIAYMHIYLPRLTRHLSIIMLFLRSDLMRYINFCSMWITLVAHEYLHLVFFFLLFFTLFFPHGFFHSFIALVAESLSYCVKCLMQHFTLVLLISHVCSFPCISCIISCMSNIIEITDYSFHYMLFYRSM